MHPRSVCLHIKNIDFPRSAIIGGVIRENEGYIALGDFKIQAGDRVVVCCMPQSIKKVESLFYQSYYMKLNLKIIFYFFGILLLFNGSFMFLSSILSFLYNDGITLSLILSGVIVSLLGLVLMLLTKAFKRNE